MRCIHFDVVQRRHRVFFDSPYLVCRTLEQAWLKCVCNIHSLPLFWTLRLCTMCQFPWQIARNCRFHFEVLSRCQKRHLINKLDSIAQSRRKIWDCSNHFYITFNKFYSRLVTAWNGVIAETGLVKVFTFKQYITRVVYKYCIYSHCWQRNDT